MSVIKDKILKEATPEFFYYYNSVGSVHKAFDEACSEGVINEVMILEKVIGTLGQELQDIAKTREDRLMEELHGVEWRNIK
jgi:hypothetical protein